MIAGGVNVVGLHGWTAEIGLRGKLYNMANTLSEAQTGLEILYTGAVRHIGSAPNIASLKWNGLC